MHRSRRCRVGCLQSAEALVSRTVSVRRRADGVPRSHRWPGSAGRPRCCSRGQWCSRSALKCRFLPVGAWGAAPPGPEPPHACLSDGGRCRLTRLYTTLLAHPGERCCIFSAQPVRGSRERGVSSGAYWLHPLATSHTESQHRSSLVQ